MPSDNYPFAVGRIRIIENGLLGQAKLARLNELSYAEAMKQLVDWGFAAEYPDKRDADGLVSFRRKEIREAVAEVTPDETLTRLFWIELDATNLKLFIKARLLGGVGLEDMVFDSGVFDAALLRSCAEQKDYSPLGEPLYSLLTKAEERLALSVDPRVLSAAVDSAIYAYVLDTLKAHRNDFCCDYFRNKIDYTNILSVLRARPLGLSGNELREMLIAGGYIDIETLAQSKDDDSLARAATTRDNERGVKLALSCPNLSETADSFRQSLLELASKARYDSFGIGPIAYFLLSGEYECGRLRAMFAEKRSRKTR